jgi:penicillin-binding protein 1A
MSSAELERERVAAPPRRQRSAEPPPARGRWLRALARVTLGLVGLAVFAGIAAAGAIAGVLWWYGRELERLDAQALRNYQPPQVTRVLARDGTIIGEIYEQRRTVVRYEDVPSHVENAFLAAEDAEFYRHEGLDWWGIARAVVANVEAGAIRQGASTITQQVVKIFLLSPERTFERKIHELILARRLEQVLDKREILELYLNEIYLGEGAYGVEEASQTYFGKSVRDVDLGEAALLAAMPKAPGRDSPFRRPEVAKARQVYVLRQMVRHGFAEPSQAEAHIAAPLPVLPPGERHARVEPGGEPFVDVAKAVLLERYGAERLPRLGAKVTTTVDLALQRGARAAALEQLRALDVRQRLGHRSKPASAGVIARIERTPAAALRVGATVDVLVQAAPPQTMGATVGANGAAIAEDGVWATVAGVPVFVALPLGSRARDPALVPAAQLPAGVAVPVRLLRAPTPTAPHWVAEVDAGPQLALLVAEVGSGDVLAMLGGDRDEPGGLNRALAARRQPGSAFKPFVYGAALASGRYTAATIVSDSPEVYAKWRPTNFEREQYRGDIRLRVALTHSVNTVAIKLLEDVGVPAVEAFARAAGLASPIADNLSSALGTSEVTPIELLEAYATLARGGERIAPRFVLAIDVPGEPSWSPPSVREPTLDPAVVHVLVSMMTSVVQEGTGKRALALGRPVAGKTGTSSEQRDAWFAGFTADHVAVSWVGFDRPRPLGRGETGGKAALPIWLAAMQQVSEGVPVRDFTVPPSVVVRTIDRTTGLLAPAEVQRADGSVGPPDPASVLEEVFVEGTAPVDAAMPEAAAAADLMLGLYEDPDGLDAGEDGAAAFVAEGAAASDGDPGDGGDSDAAPGAGAVDPSDGSSHPRGSDDGPLPGLDELGRREGRAGDALPSLDDGPR